MPVVVASESTEGVICKGEVKACSGRVTRISAVIVAATPALDNSPKGSYTAGPAAARTCIAVQHDAHCCWTRGIGGTRPSGLGALADAPGFSTDALMRRKASEKRRERRCSE